MNLCLNGIEMKNAGINFKSNVLFDREVKKTCCNIYVSKTKTC